MTKTRKPILKIYRWGDGVYRYVVAAISQKRAAELFRCSTYDMAHYGTWCKPDEDDAWLTGAPDQVWRQHHARFQDPWEPWGRT